MTKLSILVFVLLIAFSINVSQQQTLRSLAEAHHKYIGYGVEPHHLTTNAEYAKIGDREFDCMTPGNAMKWDATEPTQGQFNFKDGDTIVQHGQAHGQKIRGHTLVWHGQLAHWVEQGHFNATGLRAVMQHHIAGVAGHWKGKIYAWDVINEAYEWDGTIRKSVWSNTLGKSFFADAFKFAHDADPAAKLYYNDYGIEGINTKSNAVYAMVKELKAQGVPIHGVGFQTHMELGKVPHDLQKNIERFTALGLDVALTEVDVKIQLPADHAKLEQQAKDYVEVFSACWVVPRCVGITIWGYTDEESWIPHVSPGWGSALIYDEHYKPKPAYDAIKKFLASHK